jgi:hypothetical protein
MIAPAAVMTRPVVATNEEIAGRLVISPATAKTHVSRILMKLGAQLVVIAYEIGLVKATRSQFDHLSHRSQSRD